MGLLPAARNDKKIILKILGPIGQKFLISRDSGKIFEYILKTFAALRWPFGLPFGREHFVVRCILCEISLPGCFFLIAIARNFMKIFNENLSPLTRENKKYFH